MNIVTLIRKSDGKRFQGFMDWDGMTRKMNFYFYDEERDGWTSDNLGMFKPIPLPKEKTVPIFEDIGAVPGEQMVQGETKVVGE